MYNNKAIYALLTAEEQAELLANKDNLEHYCWVKKQWTPRERVDIDFYDSVVYRIAAQPLIVPWSAIDDQWNWAAANFDGKVWLYSDRPALEKLSWVASKGASYAANGVIVFTRGARPWDDSLVGRAEPRRSN